LDAHLDVCNCWHTRPDVGVIEGQARSQFGCRVCFQADRATSLIVLDDKIASELDDTPGRAVVKKEIHLLKLKFIFGIKKLYRRSRTKNYQKMI